ncbi:hypothetical protein [Nannocystis pusilla]|uniref:hypothetical protein n=1 Tax=Nannocystis pusilla TaxID=889268 RepID=UPI003B821CE9
MSLLLRHLEANGPLSRADLEAATRRQQLAGGSLDTAILELGLMTPLQLDALLQSACGLPARRCGCSSAGRPVPGNMSRETWSTSAGPCRSRRRTAG